MKLNYNHSKFFWAHLGMLLIAIPLVYVADTKLQMFFAAFSIGANAVGMLYSKAMMALSKALNILMHLHYNQSHPMKGGE